MENRAGRIILLVVTAVLLLSFTFGGGIFAGGKLAEYRSANLGASHWTAGAQPQTGRQIPVDLGLIEEAIHLAENAYVEPVPQKKLVEGAIRGVLAALEDPYTHYLPTRAYENFKMETAGKFFGVGIQLGMKAKHLTVIAPLPDTPAAKAGIKTGDIIAKINGKPADDFSIEEAVKTIRGPEGTKVTLSVARKGAAKLLTYRLTRKEIRLVNVTSKMVSPEIGYVYLHSFNESASEDVRRELAKLQGKGAKALVLDLRNNPGGLLQQAVAVGSVFIEVGPIVKVVDRAKRVEWQNALGNAETDIPLVVLVNKGSASASEIVAGAIKDSKRGVLVGEPTFGKASVQKVLNLSDGSAVSITVAHYFTPKGRNIQKHGVRPDYIVRQKDDLLTKKDAQLRKAIELLKARI